MVLHDSPVHFGMDAVFLGDVGPYLCVRAVHLVGHGLADVVEQAPCLGHLLVGPNLSRQHARDEGDFDRMAQDVLAVAVAVPEAAQQLYQVGVEAADSGIEDRLFPFALDGVVHLLLNPLYHVLNPSRMYPAVLNELLHGQTGCFSADGIEA